MSSCLMLDRIKNSLEGMMISKSIAFALTAALASGVVAQERSAAPIAAGEKAGGAAEIYQSAFSDYKSFREPEVMSWRASNDQVRDGGVGAHDMGNMSGGASMPAHDMQSMKPEATGSGTPGRNGGPAKDAGGMEGHDMGKMDKTGSAPVREGKNGATAKASVQQKAKPAHDMSKMKPGSGAVTDMPGHDMAAMKKSMPKPATPSPKAAPKAATPAPSKMMDHSKMNEKE